MNVLREMEWERMRKESDAYIRWIPYIRERERERMNNRGREYLSYWCHYSSNEANPPLGRSLMNDCIPFSLNPIIVWYEYHRCPIQWCNYTHSLLSLQTWVPSDSTGIGRREREWMEVGWWRVDEGWGEVCLHSLLPSSLLPSSLLPSSLLPSLLLSSLLLSSLLSSFFFLPCLSYAGETYVLSLIISKVVSAIQRVFDVSAYSVWLTGNVWN